ncbi:histone-lysine N-methyltransferase [Rhynchospora pubera]|uniref:Histone-lysine N-methyltransferase n=1 Tax=Rhynchospora pubera TaxID=906938 RepID=A0AAV8CC94_9POAL|nr:histone-lysine N-methyltransferase [Rhynchospora pubera]
MADPPLVEAPVIPPLSFLPPCSSSSSFSSQLPPAQSQPETLTSTLDRWDFLRSPIKAGSSVVLKRDRSGDNRTAEKSLEDHVADWREKKVKSGVPEIECDLPFLTHAPRMIECRVCYRGIHPGEEIRCMVYKCKSAFHRSCAELKFKLPKQKVVSNDERNRKRRKSGQKYSGPAIRCPLHECMICKEVNNWKCVKCTVAAHPKCAPWKELVLEGGKQAICWRHPSNWLLQNKDVAVTNDIQEVFDRLPIPYIEEEFSIDTISSRDMTDKSGDIAVKKEDIADETEYITDKKNIIDKGGEPPPFIRIKRNIYLVKRKRDTITGVGCTSCNSESSCKVDCECRGLSVSCSKACYCAGFCTNKPFRKEKKIRVVKTEHCGWGVITLEPLQKGDFIIEYIGEVIDDLTCEKRLWDMKERGDSNFYMCEISKDFTIDATFKGNNSRFLNHSCDPNCSLEKWQVDGETRVGVFALRSIKVNEPLTYDYRFVHFGAKVVCKCGSENCQGSLGIKRVIQQGPVDMPASISNCQAPRPQESLLKITGDDRLPSSWGCKTKRTEKVPRLVQPPVGNSDVEVVDRSPMERSCNAALVPAPGDLLCRWGRRIRRSYSSS